MGSYDQINRRVLGGFEGWFSNVQLENDMGLGQISVDPKFPGEGFASDRLLVPFELMAFNDICPAVCRRSICEMSGNQASPQRSSRQGGEPDSVEAMPINKG